MGELLLRPALPQGWLLLLGGCPGARFMSSVFETMSTRGSKGGQIRVGGGKFAHGQISHILLRTNWGMEMAHEASAAMGMTFT